MGVAEHVTTAAPGTAKWQAIRTRGLGGSEVAAALGLSPWDSPFALWHRKTGALPPVSESESMRWGKLLEPVVLAEWERRRDPDREPCWRSAHVRQGTYVADGWRIASPDGIYTRKRSRGDYPDAILEAKTADSNTAWQWGDSGSDDPAAVPIYYRCQVLWYGDVLGVHDLHLAVLIGGNDYREYRIPWDQAEVDDLRSRAHAFWLTVGTGQPPSIDDSTATYQAVRALHPDIDADLEVQVDPDLVDEWRGHDQAAKAAAAGVQRCRSLIADQMGDARYGLIGDERVVRRQAQGTGSPYPLLVTRREKAAA